MIQQLSSTHAGACFYTNPCEQIMQEVQSTSALTYFSQSSCGSKLPELRSQRTGFHIVFQRLGQDQNYVGQADKVEAIQGTNFAGRLYKIWVRSQVLQSLQCLGCDPNAGGICPNQPISQYLHGRISSVCASIS